MDFINSCNDSGKATLMGFNKSSFENSTFVSFLVEQC